MNRSLQLKYQFMKELKLRNYADSSINTYASCLMVFFCAHKKFNNYIALDDVKNFLLTITNQNYHKQMVATIHHFYRIILKKPLSLDDIPYPRKTNYLPNIFSLQEINALLNSFDNLKHKAILQVMYSCALRTSEVINIKIEHVQSDRNIIRIAGAKGFKDRDVPVPADTLILLRSYYKSLPVKPKVWLFEGQFPGEQYSERSLQQIFRQGCKRIGIKRYMRPHCLRHSRATHLKEALIDIKDIKDFLGHNNLKTTEIYLQTAKQSLVNRIAVADKILNSVFNKVTAVQVSDTTTAAQR